MKTLQERLRKARSDAGLSQADVARRVGIKQPTYSELERAEGKGTKHLVKIADVLGVSPDWLATGRGSALRSGDPVEKELTTLFRGLDESQQKLFLRMLRSASDEAQ